MRFERIFMQIYFARMCEKKTRFHCLDFVLSRYLFQLPLHAKLAPIGFRNFQTSMVRVLFGNYLTLRVISSLAGNNLLFSAQFFCSNKVCRNPFSAPFWCYSCAEILPQICSASKKKNLIKKIVLNKLI